MTNIIEILVILNLISFGICSSLILFYKKISDEQKNRAENWVLQFRNVNEALIQAHKWITKRKGEDHIQNRCRHKWGEVNHYQGQESSVCEDCKLYRAREIGARKWKYYEHK